MRHLRRIVVLVGITSGSLACDNPANPLRHVTVSVAVSSSLIRRGETTQITTTFQNTSWRDAYIPSSSCGPRFTILNEDGEQLPLWPELCTLSLPAPIRLAPGESAQFTGTWDGRDRDGIRTPGDYRVTVTGAAVNAIVVRVVD
jgi:hypothetical protein